MAKKYFNLVAECPTKKRVVKISECRKCKAHTMDQQMDGCEYDPERLGIHYFYATECAVNPDMVNKYVSLAKCCECSHCKGEHGGACKTVDCVV